MAMVAGELWRLVKERWRSEKDDTTTTTNANAAGLGLARLADGTPVSSSTARRLACDAGILPVVLGGKSQPIDVGRERRTASRYQRAAMLARSNHCEWPGCTVPADWCDAHHLVPWEARGPTDIENLAFMCNTHHHDAHEGGWDVRRHPLTGEIVVDPPSRRSPACTTPRRLNRPTDVTSPVRPPGCARPASSFLEN
jgi:hypothetical protein